MGKAGEGGTDRPLRHAATLADCVPVVAQGDKRKVPDYY
jgi:hypothetical protein